MAAPADLAEFARWAFGDLRANTHRGWYAEWLVLRAVGGVAASPRSEWAAWDITTQAGVTIEVKSTGLLQDWMSEKPSPPTFTGLSTRRWTGVGNEYTERKVIADVYVFMVHTCTDPAAYDVGDPAQWECLVVAGDTVRAWNQNSIRLSELRRRAALPNGGVHACTLAELSDARLPRDQPAA